MRKATRELIVVCNLDVVKGKNHYQVDALPEFEFLFLSYRAPTGAVNRGGRWAAQLYPRSVFLRLLFILRLFYRRRASIHHVEIYTGNGAFFAIEFIVAKLLGLKVLAAERGALLHYANSRLLRRIAFWLVFRFADEVWLRELWMVPALANIVNRTAFFCFNAVSLPEKNLASVAEIRDVDFLWVNSFKPWRNPTWLVSALAHENLRDCRSVMIGLLNDTSKDVLAEQEAVKRAAAQAQVDLVPFSDPRCYYERARFFVLPADIVFLNFALLEAMAHGIVPLVSDVEGAREIIEDGVEGFVFPHTREGFTKTMLHVRGMSDEDWSSMSLRAREKVYRKFSLESWGERMRTVYSRLAKP